MTFRLRSTLQEHISKRHEGSMNVAFTHGKGRAGKVYQVKVEFAKDAAPICRSKRDAQHNMQQGGEIPTYGKEDEIVNLWFTHYGTKFFDSGA